MTFHTRAATDEIYSIFNQPLKSETGDADHGDSLFESDYEDDDYTSAGESIGTGRVSAGTSEFGDEEISTPRKVNEDEDDESVGAGEWTEFSTSKHVPKIPSDSEGRSKSGEVDAGHDDVTTGQFSDESGLFRDGDSSHSPRRDKFIPEMPEDYDPPVGPYRDAVVMAQNRLPFMTPIIERTESSLPMTTARHHIYEARTPCRPVPEANYTPPGLPKDLLGSSPFADLKNDEDLSAVHEDFSPIPAVKKLRLTPEKLGSSRNIFESASIIKEEQCDPTDKGIRKKILKSIDPPLTSYAGYHDHCDAYGNHATDIQKFIKALKKPSRSGDKTSFTPPVLSFTGADRTYAIRRELGAGAYAPVYLVESADNIDDDSSSSEAGSDIVNAKKKRSLSSDSNSEWQRNLHRYDLEAVKVETDPPSAWEFYMIRTAQDRLRNSLHHSRVVESIVNAHEFHLFKDESFLVEDYRGQGTLLDLVNIVRTEAITSTGNAEAGMDEALAMFFAVELFRTVEGLHACGIIHGDIKPDNCLVRFDEKSKTSLPTPPNSQSLIDLEEDNAIPDPSEVHYSPRGLCDWHHRGLTLIDFGRGIDMRAFQPGVQFIAEWEIGQHECNEVREMRPWTYQIDLYGIAVTIHTMLFGKYLESVPIVGENPRSPSGNNGNGNGEMGSARRYRIREPLKRYWEREIWNDVFDLLLNPTAERWAQMEREGSSSTTLPVLQSMKYVREKMETWLVANAEKRGLSLQIRKLESHLSRRKEKLDREKRLSR
jgi:checkpoint serine/threonine-protein kinase